VGGSQPGCEAGELAFRFERRVDQHQTAPFLGRQMRLERQPAVERQHPDLDVAGKARLERDGGLRLDLDRRQPVPAAQQLAHEHRRARIEGEAAGGVQRPHGCQIGLEEGRGGPGGRMQDEPADAARPLAGPLRLRARQIVAAGAGMGVDDPQRCILALQIEEDACQHRMLEHVGGAAGVVDVTVVHLVLALHLGARTG
jgi:hypothetical protein